MRKAVFVIAAILTVGAGAPPEANQAEMAKLEGEWSMVSGEIDGQAMPAEFVKTGKRVAKDGETTVTINGQLFMRAKFTIDPAKKPKAIDYTFTGGPTAGKTQHGIYELDGDTVKFCFASPGQARPAEFTTKPGSGRTLSVWKRTAKRPSPSPARRLMAFVLASGHEAVLCGN